MKKIIVASLLLIAFLCKAADDRYLHLIDAEAWNGLREVAQCISYYSTIGISRFAAPNELDLRGYKLKTFPDNLAGFHWGLILDNNLIKDIPLCDGNYKLFALRHLSLNNNRIATTANVRDYYNLTELELNNNLIKDISNLNGGQLRILLFLHLNNNQIQVIPDDFQLHNLQILSLNNNRIQAIDPHVLDQLLGLRELHVEENYLSKDNITELKAYAEGRGNLTIFPDNQKKGLNYKGSRR